MIRPAIRIGKSEPTRVTYKVPVYITVIPGLHAHHTSVMGVPDRIASQRTLVAQRGCSLEVPSAHFEPCGLVGVNAGGTDIHQVPGKRAFEFIIREPAEIDAISDLHRPEVSVSGKFPVKPGTSVAMDAAVHFMLNIWPQILVSIGSLFAPVYSNGVSAGPSFVLQQTLSALIAYRAIQGVIHHQQFDYSFAELDCLFVRSRNHHPILSVDHATHLNALEWTMDEFDGAHPARANRSQRLVIAKARNHDAQPFGGIDDFAPLRDIHFKIVNDQPGHGTDILFG
jgi:hypothetical protein